MGNFLPFFLNHHFSSGKKVGLITLLALGFLFESTSAQTIYAGGANGLYAITISGGSCSVNFVGAFINAATGTPVFAGDIAICPDGTLYITDNSNVWEVDPSNGQCTLVAASSTYLGIVGLGCAGNGILYGTAFALNGSGGLLYQINANTGTIVPIGDMGFSSAGDIVNYNGTWYMTSISGLVEVNVSNPPASTLVHPNVSYVGMTVFPNDCNTLLGGDGDNLYLIDLDDGSTSAFCSVPGVQIGGLTTVAEFATSSVTCNPTLDLDLDDSSGAIQADFNAPNFNCGNLNTGVNIADIDVEIDSDETIATLTVNIASGNADGPNEVLELATANNISVSGSGTSTIILTNTGAATVQDFTNALLAIVYKNQLVPPTPGLREIEVGFTTVPGSESNVATCFVSVDAFDNLAVDLGPDQALCPGAEAVLDAGHPGASFSWSNGSTDQVVFAQASGIFSVTVSDATNCPGTDEVELTLAPVYTLGLSGDAAICDGEAAELTLSLGSNIPIIDVLVNEMPSGNTISLEGVFDGFSFLVNPTTTSTYSITFVNENGFCINDFSGLEWTVTVGTTSFQSQTLELCEGDSIFIAGAWQTGPGIFEETFESFSGCDSTISNTVVFLQNIIQSIFSLTCDPSATGIFENTWTAANGCDSTVIETVSLTSIPPTEIFTNTCNPSEVGVNTQTFTSSQGCDSLVITTTTLLNSDIVEISDTSCDPAEVGIFTEILTNQSGCDSTVITSIAFALSDTTEIFGTSCDPADAGVFVEVFNDSNGCDSTVITAVTYTPIDDTFIFENTCNPDQVGIEAEVFFTQAGCDSVVFIQTDLLPSDTSSLSFESCNPDDVGVFEEVFENQFGCDSLVVTTVTLSTGDLIFISSQTCDPDDVGIFTEIFTDQFGCDSTVVTSVSLLPLDTIFLTDESCNPDDVGISTEILTNQFGCDSMVVITVSLLPSDETFVASQTCDPNDLGTFTETFSNQFGCDSTVTTTVTLSLTDTVFLSGTSCDLDEVGIFEETWMNQLGCDSTIITEITLAESDTTFISLQSCNPSDVGVFTESFIVAGTCDSTVLTSVSLLQSDLTILNETTCEDGEAGSTEMIFTNVNGCDSIVVTVTSLLPFDECGTERPRIYVPNAFSPNSDGLNDYFLLFGNEQVQRVLTFQVFSRWGERVFEMYDAPPNDVSGGWDGTFRGEPMGIGVYAFWAEVEMTDGSREMVEGDVILVR